MPLILTTLGSTHQNRQEQVDHSGLHNLSKEHILVATSFPVTPDRAKNHHISYLVGKNAKLQRQDKLLTFEIVQRQFPQWVAEAGMLLDLNI